MRRSSLLLLFFLLMLLHVNVCVAVCHVCAGSSVAGRNRHRIPWHWVTGSFEFADVGTMNWTGILCTSSKGCSVTIEPSSLHTPRVLLPQQVLRIPHGILRYHNHAGKSCKMRNCGELTRLDVKWNPKAGNVGRMGGYRCRPLPAKASPQIIRSWNWSCWDRSEMKKWKIYHTVNTSFPVDLLIKHVARKELCVTAHCQPSNTVLSKDWIM